MCPEMDWTSDLLKEWHRYRMRYFPEAEEYLVSGCSKDFWPVPCFFYAMAIHKGDMKWHAWLILLDYAWAGWILEVFWSDDLVFCRSICPLNFVLCSGRMNQSYIQRRDTLPSASLHSILDIRYVEKPLSDLLMLILSLSLCASCSVNKY